MMVHESSFKETEFGTLNSILRLNNFYVEHLKGSCSKDFKQRLKSSAQWSDFFQKMSNCQRKVPTKI